ncbi:cell division protein FtsQ [Mucilaginibacter terrenus]|uniref:cell division protein FtsQ n=1 Tax=Mucilaginibacter terrenus TaxID=2482727 RepID=UPI00197C4D7B|nr:cell division protein FtsQ [Mucilaginibacter terrenus]
MFKKRIWKPLLIGLGWTISLAGLVVLMSFIEVKKSEVVCKAIKVYIPGSHYFIDRQEVDNILEMDSHTLIGRRIEAIDIHALEERLKNNPFVEFAKVYVDMDGVIQVEVSQRQPILRVMNRFDQDFYIDQHGLKMPLSQSFTARVIAANGYIDELFANKVDSLHTGLAKQIFATADFIRKDSLWDAQIAQIYVNQDHEIELVPRVGNQRILLGNADSLDVRFNNLKAFYKQAVPLVGWDAYKQINIKYTNQVIGVKNQTLLDSLAMAKKEAARKATADSIRNVMAGSAASTDSVTVAPVSSNVAKPEVKKQAAESKPVVRKVSATTTSNSKPVAKVTKPAVVKAAAKKQPEKAKATKPSAKPAVAKAVKQGAKKTTKKTST